MYVRISCNLGSGFDDLYLLSGFVSTPGSRRRLCSITNSIVVYKPLDSHGLRRTDSHVLTDTVAHKIPCFRCILSTTVRDELTMMGGYA